MAQAATPITPPARFLGFGDWGLPFQVEHAPAGVEAVLARAARQIRYAGNFASFGVDQVGDAFGI